MAEQIDLAVPAAAAAPAPKTPWEWARAKHAGALVTRVIHMDANQQYFLRLNPIPERRDEAALYDGATIITPSVPSPGRSDAEIAAIIAQADAAWHQGRA